MLYYQSMPHSEVEVCHFASVPEITGTTEAGEF